MSGIRKRLAEAASGDDAEASATAAAPSASSSSAAQRGGIRRRVGAGAPALSATEPLVRRLKRDWAIGKLTAKQA